jgi:hypothetical protein
VGGIVFSLILTLFIIPAIYTYLSGKHKYKAAEATSNDAAVVEENKEGSSNT